MGRVGVGWAHAGRRVGAGGAEVGRRLGAGWAQGGRRLGGGWAEVGRRVYGAARLVVWAAAVQIRSSTAVQRVQQAHPALLSREAVLRQLCTRGGRAAGTEGVLGACGRAACTRQLEAQPLIRWWHGVWRAIPPRRPAAAPVPRRRRAATGESAFCFGNFLFVLGIKGQKGPRFKSICSTNTYHGAQGS